MQPRSSLISGTANGIHEHVPLYEGGTHHLHIRFPCDVGTQRQFQAGSVLAETALVCYSQCMQFMNDAHPIQFNICLPIKSGLCHELDLAALLMWPLLAGFDRFWINFIGQLATKRPFLATQAGHGQTMQAVDCVSAHARRRPFIGHGLRSRPRRLDSATCSICVPFWYRECSTHVPQVFQKSPTMNHNPATKWNKTEHNGTLFLGTGETQLRRDSSRPVWTLNLTQCDHRATPHDCHFPFVWVQCLPRVLRELKVTG